MNINDVFQTENVNAIEAAGRSGMAADKAVYLTMAQAFSLFLQTYDSDENPFVEFLRIAHYAALGVSQRIKEAGH